MPTALCRLLFLCALSAVAAISTTPPTLAATTQQVPLDITPSSIDHRRPLSNNDHADVVAAFVARAVAFAVQTITDDSLSTRATLVRVVRHSVHRSVDHVSTFVPEYREQV
jgi:hypothetical protein